MSRGDAAVETAAEKLERFVEEGQASGGVRAKLAEQFQGDPEFLRRLKPSLIKARAKGDAPPPQPPPAERRTEVKRPKRPGGGPSPWLVVGLSLAAGIALAKVIDWRGHAHPRL